MSVFNNRVKDDLLGNVRSAYEDSGLGLAQFMVELFEVLEYFTEYVIDEETNGWSGRFDNLPHVAICSASSVAER